MEFMSAMRINGTILQNNQYEMLSLLVAGQQVLFHTGLKKPAAAFAIVRFLRWRVTW